MQATKPFAVTLDVGSSLLNRTGSWRTERPVYVDRLPPCNQACPAGENIQAWLYHAEEGNYRAAWDELMKNNPLPAIMGRACYHPCQDSCNRATLDSSVNIHAVERFLGDLAIREGWSVENATPSSGAKVLVIGAGPSGLSAAYHLALMGHQVSIREAGPVPGGMMRFGIPKYRLPRDVVDAEVQRIVDMGVTLELDARVDDIPAALSTGGFDACFAAIGAHLAKKVDIPAPDAMKILDAVSFLRGMETDDAPLKLGRRVVVYGGGNTAVDVARTAKRLGAEPVIVYRRTREQMPAHDFEIDEALEEGVVVNWLRTIKEADEHALKVETMVLDDNGWPQPTGEFETIEADTVVLALGQNVDQSLLTNLQGVELNRDGVVEVGADMMTAYPGVFAGGDMVPSERTVTVAVGHGKKAARNIDAYLRGVSYAPAPKHEVASFEQLNTWYYTDAEQAVQPILDDIRRRTTFDEVVSGLDEGNALFEARRCLSCGNCFECDNCYGICPDNAITKLGPGQRFEFKYDYCKGCAMCATECPCGAIKMVPEQI
ncbi:MAG: FAD-dependent oxidoreductase [Gammaproteobacteria bacterium]|nr:FAD-dependent oxidoreductase [Gammaproteobacteria bacterium]NCF81039.1 FAD-dependent oxidoreductase [Pseudomonadota bacterium]